MFIHLRLYFKVLKTKGVDPHKRFPWTHSQLTLHQLQSLSHIKYVNIKYSRLSKPDIYTPEIVRLCYKSLTVGAVCIPAG